MIQGDRPYTRNGEFLPGQQWPPGMTRVALSVEYNGVPYHGFQAQRTGVATVQRTLEAALSKIAAEAITLVCAGRTDAAVHATNQVVHFDTLAERRDRAWVLGTNTHLPDTISVRWSRVVEPQFHARFSARCRTYRYLIYNGAVRTALQHDQFTYFHRALDLEAMRAGAATLLGEHDFSAFRASQCQAKNPVRRIDRLDIARFGDLVILEVRANAFLHHMVRNIAGVLLAVGCGDCPPGWVAEVLASRDRNAAGVTAPAAGLYLVAIDYPARFGLPPQVPGPHCLPFALGRLPGLEGGGDGDFRGGG
ncbi:tRNA pseudouridine(38-40) synthase TruA [Exilibacterium tricleocarpae]|uniref:tRNA pseudouridine synthase A n=1 Tax=Exilibacterium tricleocarpae TaxID=2591008 RepID=A0A545SRV0_9GAMM|nr:tRNA pseudouridine(38-40) synthase TruA [Exilibacterium tricleocarpae]TQV67692.1 tRNA pseudouridine(38-40) synthase TruA [Exilibacterium tricleocarpae]